MKNFTRLFAMLLCMASYFSVSAQSIYRDYNDGQMYIKILNQHTLGKTMGDEVLIGQVPFLEKVASKYGITKIRRPFYRSISYDMRQVYKVYFSEFAKVDEFIRDVQKDFTVEYAERVPLMKLAIVPNDMGTQSWTNGNWSLFRINAQGAWDNTTGSTSTKIAIVDNAIQITHTDLSANIWVNPGEIAGNNIDDDGNGYIDDVNGWDAGDNDNNPMPPNTSFSHGTHCSGIASATTNNNTGIASIGYSCKIMAVKATSNSSGSNSISNGFEGVDYAMSAGADVISLSWGGGGSSQTEQNLLTAAYNQGIIILAAAGNDGVNSVFYPAGYNNVMSVASTGNGGSNDIKSSFSNYGSWIDISAPGANINSTVPTNAYDIFDGTSMATPLVAGLAGLIVSINPNLTPAQIQACIQNTAANINSSNSSYVGQLGAGRIDAAAATACALATVTPYDAAIIAIPSPSVATCSTTIIPQVTLKNTGQQVLTAATINYQVDGGTAQSFNWVGTLASQASVNVTMPSITVSIGNHTYTTTLGSLLNITIADGNATNNTQTSSFSALNSSGQSLPFSDDFESGSFATKGWTIVNPANDTTWRIITTAGQQAGTKSARMHFFSYPTAGQRDGMVTPTLSLSGLSSASISFEYAYRRYNGGNGASATDSLIVSVSTDCGGTYPYRMFIGGESGAGNFATAASSGTDFVTASADDWCFGAAPGVTVCPTINLNQFLGQAIRVKFEGYNSYGNNLYVDDVNITGVVASVPPVASFTASSNSICAGQSITFTSTSTNSPTSYAWTFPSGTPGTSTSASQAVTFNTAGTYTITLVATNSAGSNTTTQSITVKPIPTVTATPATPSVCAGSSVTLVASGATTYGWSPATGLNTTSGATVISTPTGTITYTITGTTNGCSGTATKTVTVNPIPVITATPATASVCAGSSVTLVASGATNYTWSPGTGLNTTNGATVIATPASTTTYTITGTTSGCTGTLTKTVTVTPIPVVTATPAVASICAGSSITLVASGGTTYGWSPATGLNTASGATVIASPTGTITYTITGTTNGCSGTTTKTVTVNQTPVLLATTADNTLCVGEQTTLNVSGGGTYTWSPATGLSSTSGASVTANPTSSNTYTVSSTVNGCTGTTTIAVTVNNLPTVGLTSSANNLCSGSSAILTATGATNYVWTGGAIDNTTVNPASVNPTQTTTYNVTGTDANGCIDTETITVTISGVSLPISANTNKDTICEGTTITLNASGATNYSWTGNGLNSTNGSSVTATPTQTTTYTAASNDGGCNSTADVTVVVNPAPITPSISVNNGVLTSSPGTYYQWYLNGQLISNATNQSYTPTQDGNYTVTVTDAGGCSATSSEISFATALAETAFGGTVNVYPNPAHNEAYVDINMNTQADITIRLFNAVGQNLGELQSIASLGGRFALPVNGLAQGLYFIEIFAGPKQTVRKLVLTNE